MSDFSIETTISTPTETLSGYVSLTVKGRILKKTLGVLIHEIADATGRVPDLTSSAQVTTCKIPLRSGEDAHELRDRIATAAAEALGR